jgi:peptide/nickel transport system substrate-binding protein
MTTPTTGIVRTTWDAKWKDYYNSRTDLLNAIATKAKALADAAQSSANTGISNAAAAKTALAAAGVTKVHMITYSNPRPYNTANGQALAEAIQGYLKSVGVTATIDAYDWTTYKQKVKTGDYDICFYGWTGDNGDPDNFMTLMSIQDPTQNVAHFNNKDYNALIAKGVSTPAGADRNKIYTDLEKLAAQNAVWLPISHGKTLCGYRSNVQDFYYHMTGNVFLSGVSKN